MNSTTSDISGYVIEYSGEESIDTYQDILRSVLYRNTEDEPIPGSVSVLVQVFTQNTTSGGQTGSNIAEVIIEVLPVNDNAPVFSEARYYIEVMEGTAIGEVVGTVLATDVDIYSGGNITYEIVSESEEFNINVISGTITTTRALDAEITSLYQLMVIAYDNDEGFPRGSTVTVIISVLDVNDNTPMFNSTQYTAYVIENAPSALSILTVSATDDDITSNNSDITYKLQILSDDLGSGSGAVYLTPLPPQQATPLPFIINPTTGEISVTDGGIIDYEMLTEYFLLAEATDNGDIPLSASVQITVFINNENDESPIFTQPIYTASVTDDSTPGTPILTVLATDLDSVDITYSIENTEYLEINSTTGDVTLKRAVDFNLTPSLTAVVIANDTGSPPRIGEATVNINVINVNNNPPMFTENNYTFSVIEGTQLWAIVNATDADQDQISYLTVEGFDDMFILDNTTGRIALSPGYELDYETQSIYRLTVTATDGIFTTSANVVIEVEDANDNPPVITSPQYVTIPESLAIGSTVIQVIAEDIDSEANADIQYSILDVSDTFVIESDTGIITVQREIDFETDTGPFEFQVIAKNTASPFFNSTITMTVLVQDTNDNQPIISIQSFSVIYTENSPPILIASDITITDADSNNHLLTSCDVTLTREECLECDENIIIDEEEFNNLNFERETTATEISVKLSGNGTESQYQTALSSLTYCNRAPEPILGTRNISIQCNDGLHSSNIIVLTIQVVPVNDNPIMIDATSQQQTFIEGNISLTIDGITLTDLDVSAEVAWLRVSLMGSVDMERERLSVNPATVTGEDREIGQDILINQLASLHSYQVIVYIIHYTSMILPQNSLFQAVLDTLTYSYILPANEEPITGDRLINISISDGIFESFVTVTISVIAINNNPPVIRFTGSSNISFMEGATVPLLLGSVLAPVISDADNNAVFLMESASVELLNAIDGLNEELNYNTEILDLLAITVNRM